MTIEQIIFENSFHLKENKRTSEALLDAQDKVNSLMEQLDNRSGIESLELQKAIADRDSALNVSSYFEIFDDK